MLLRAILPVEDKHLEMNTRTKHTFQTVIENRVLVKVLPKVRAWLFCMNEPYLHTTLNELGNESQKWLFLFVQLHIKVFYVGSTNPKQVLNELNP